MDWSTATEEEAAAAKHKTATATAKQQQRNGSSDARPSNNRSSRQSIYTYNSTITLLSLILIAVIIILLSITLLFVHTQPVGIESVVISLFVCTKQRDCLFACVVCLFVCVDCTGLQYKKHDPKRGARLIFFMWIIFNFHVIEWATWDRTASISVCLVTVVIFGHGEIMPCRLEARVHTVFACPAIFYKNISHRSPILLCCSMLTSQLDNNGHPHRWM